MRGVPVHSSNDRYDENKRTVTMSSVLACVVTICTRIYWVFFFFLWFFTPRISTRNPRVQYEYAVNEPCSVSYRDRDGPIRFIFISFYTPPARTAPFTADDVTIRTLCTHSIRRIMHGSAYRDCGARITYILYFIFFIIIIFFFSPYNTVRHNYIVYNILSLGGRGRVQQ
jgi:hypothetical protein